MLPEPADPLARAVAVVRTARRHAVGRMAPRDLADEAGVETDGPSVGRLIRRGPERERHRGPSCRHRPPPRRAEVPAAIAPFGCAPGPARAWHVRRRAPRSEESRVGKEL